MKSFSLIWCITSLTGGISFLLIPSNLSWSQLRVSTATNSSIKCCSRWIKLICYISATVLTQTRKYYIFPNDVTFDKNCTLTWYLSQWGRLLNNIFRLIKIYISLIDSLTHSLTHSLILLQVLNNSSLLYQWFQRHSCTLIVYAHPSWTIWIPPSSKC